MLPFLIDFFFTFLLFGSTAKPSDTRAQMKGEEKNV